MKIVTPIASSKPHKQPLVDRISKLIAAGEDVLSAMKGASEKDLIQARKACSSLGWRTEVAFDAELVNVEHAKRGRGNRDIKGVGVNAAISRQASALGVSISTVRLNVRIFTTFFKNGLSSYDNLSEKGFFQLALLTEDPVRTIRFFEKSVARKSDFSHAEAARWVEQQKQRQNLPVLDSPLASHIVWAKKELLRIQRMCPDKKFGERFYSPLIQDLDDHLMYMGEEQSEQRCRIAWDKGNYREGQIAEATGLDRRTVAAAMLRLSEQNEFWEVKEVTHGRHDKRWQKSGVPLGSNYSVVSKAS